MKLKRCAVSNLSVLVLVGILEFLTLIGLLDYRHLIPPSVTTLRGTESWMNPNNRLDPELVFIHQRVGDSSAKRVAIWSAVLGFLLNVDTDTMSR